MAKHVPLIDSNGFYRFDPDNCTYRFGVLTITGPGEGDTRHVGNVYSLPDGTFVMQRIKYFAVGDPEYCWKRLSPERVLYLLAWSGQLDSCLKEAWFAPLRPLLDRKDVGQVELVAAGFVYRDRVTDLTGRPLAMLAALLESPRHRCTALELRGKMVVDDDAVNYPEQVVRDTAMFLRAALKKAISAAGHSCEDPLPSIGRGKELSYQLAMP